MKAKEKLFELISYYQNKYRAKDLPEFEFVEQYDFGCQRPCPPLAARQGVYAIFSGEELLYIGKASSPKSAIWHRIYQHIEFDNDFNYVGTRNKSWSKKPTHFIGWAVPKESFFEASALEEFLIHALRDGLPDNRIK